jgi:hypothetical protein
MHSACPRRSAPPWTRQAPRTTSIPTNPISRPKPRCAENFSVRKISTAIGSTINGVMPFQMPASSDGMRCSPYPKRVHGIADPIAPTTNECAHSRGSRGSGSRFTTRIATSTTEPASTRPSAR